MEALKPDEKANENVMFRITVRKTNYFSLKFNYLASINSKHYHFFIERLLLTPHGDYKNLLIGSSIVKGQSPLSFGVCNIGESLALKQPRFDIDALIKVPFFRAGHFFNISNSSTYKKGENSLMSIELIGGPGGSVLIMDKVELVSGQAYTMPVAF